MSRPLELRPLGDRPLNDNYQPPRAWTCQTYAAHECAGTVVGFVGAYPVCSTGAPAEVAAQRADRERIAALMDTPEFRAAAAAEMAWEARVS